MSQRELPGDEHLTAWVTAYALTGGIEKVEGIVSHSISSGMLRFGGMNYAHGKDWHRTEAEAKTRAEEMRLAKIKSLQKQLAKLQALTF